MTICYPLSTGKWLQNEWPWMTFSGYFMKNAFSASNSWIRAFECQKYYNLCDSAVFCALHDQLASLGRRAQLTRCFSAVAELLVLKELRFWDWYDLLVLHYHFEKVTMQNDFNVWQPLPPHNRHTFTTICNIVQEMLSASTIHILFVIGRILQRTRRIRSKTKIRYSEQLQ